MRREPSRSEVGAVSGPSPLQTEFAFTLPSGYVDPDGTLHREGTMRLATAADEILPLKDPRVRNNESYLTVILLSRVVTGLGTLDDVTTHVVENLFVSDLAYLQELYERVNSRGADVVDTTCPQCGESFEATVEPGTPGHAHARSETAPSTDDTDATIDDDTDPTIDTDTDASSPSASSATADGSRPAPSTEDAGSRGSPVRVGAPRRPGTEDGSGNSDRPPASDDGPGP